jgi:hypothetical protein
MNWGVGFEKQKRRGLQVRAVRVSANSSKAADCGKLKVLR